MVIKVMATLLIVMLIGMHQIPVVLLLAFDVGPMTATSAAAQFVVLDVLLVRWLRKELRPTLAPAAESRTKENA